MSKQSTRTQARATSQPAQTRRQRRRPRGEVYRQPPRVRTRTQHAVQALDASLSGTWDELGMPPVGTEEPPAATSTVEPLEAEHEAAYDAMLDAEQSVLSDEPSQMDTAAPGNSQSQSRMPRRTRTLADVVQPRRDPALSGGAMSVPSLPSMPSIPRIPITGPLSDPAPSGSDPAAAVPGLIDANAAGADTDRAEPTFASDEPGDERGDESGNERGDEPESDALTAPLAVARSRDDDSGPTPIPSRRPVASISVPRSARMSVETRPIAAIAGASSPSRPRPHVPVGDPWGTSPVAIKDDEEIPSRFLRGARQGVLALAVRVALGHAIAAVALAVVASALVLLAQPLGLWLLALAGLAAVGGGLAYLLLWWLRSARMGLLVLALTQMGALAWCCALLGPRAALLVLAAPAVALALRAGGRWPALLAGTGLVAVYGVFQFAPRWGFPPAFTPSMPVLAAVDMVAVALGFGLLLVELLAAAHARERDLAAARARLYEVRLLRGQIGVLRAEVDDSARALDEALAQAVCGRGADPLALDSPLSLVAGRVNVVAERLRVLQRDRAERLRLEGATRTLARALERGWLGLPWVWPERSGTLLDEVIALLRTPRPADAPSNQHENQASEPRATSLP